MIRPDADGPETQPEASLATDGQRPGRGGSTMATRTLALRFVSLLAMTVWVGGFTFYSAVVIPVLHDTLGSRETGLVTQRVTNAINAAGLAAVGCWWLMAACERRAVSARLRRTRLLLLIGTTALLAFLLVMHRVMDYRLEQGLSEGFYPLHRAYLIASTAEWFINLGLLLNLLSAAPAPEIGHGAQ